MRHPPCCVKPSSSSRYIPTYLAVVLALGGILYFQAAVELDKILRREEERTSSHPPPAAAATAATAAAVAPFLPSRAFLLWNESGNPPPCVIDRPDDPGFDPFSQKVQGQPSREGILFLKVDKAGSSTVAGVGARIAVALARKAGATDAAATGGEDAAPSQRRRRTARACRSRLSHIWSKRMTDIIQERDRARSFLFTVIREPGRRAVSEFWYFRAGRDGAEPTEDNLLRHLRGTRNFQLAKVMTRRRDNTYKMSMHDEAATNRTVQYVLNNLDFIGTLERLDESLVLLQLILDLETRDVLYLTAKDSGSEFVQRGRRGSRLSFPRIDEFLSSDEWKRTNSGDLLLYRAVDESIDRTINAVGRSAFEIALGKFRRDQVLANQECQTNATIQSGLKCYWSDSGCNYPCLDRLFGV